MRKTIIFGALAALLGLAAVAQANDRAPSGVAGATQLTGNATHDEANDGRVGARQDRDARNEHAGKAAERQGEGHDAGETAEQERD